MTTPIEDTAHQYFGRMVAEYDSLIRRTVPRYEELSERLVEYLPGARRVLELGCGTGNLTLRLLERFKEAHVTAVDASTEMTAVTRARAQVRGFGERLELHRARFEELGESPGSFDLVTSCISLHHVLDKRALFAQLARSLAPGGSLVFADQLRGGDDASHAINWRRWLEFSRSEGGCTEAEVESLLAHAAAHDHYVSLADHFELLSAAGFVQLDCVWRNWIWAIVVARDPRG